MIKTYIVTLSLINVASGFHLQNNNILNKVHVNFGKKNKNVESEYVDQQKKEKKKNTLYEPKSYNQEKYLRAINNDNIKLVICAGPAGTGKTIFTTQYAADLLITQASKVVLTRPLISVDEELGYLPGDINQKMDPWIIPIFDILREYLPQSKINSLIDEKLIEIVPLAFMRGRTFKNTFIICDEMQNTSINQMLMLLTRIGENSKMVITGDITQCDRCENGLKDLIERLVCEHDEIELIEMEKKDIERSSIVKTILTLYEG
jgi:phosphate starvation-inducible PhoH-like protein